MKSARWILILLAVPFLVPSAGAATQVVDTKGALVTVTVVRASGRAGGPPALTYSVLKADGSLTSGWVSRTRDRFSDREPSLIVGPGVDQPVLIWSRRDGRFDQIAYSRFDGKSWSEPRYLTAGAENHLHPVAGVDGNASGFVIWLEPSGGGRLMFAQFDPSTGNLYSGPKDLLRELVRHSPPEWLRPEPGVPGGGGDEAGSGGGTNDGPAIPPNGHKVEDPPIGDLTLNSGCTRIAVAVVKHRSLHIGILEGGMVLKYYRSQVPLGAPDNYVSLLLQGLLDQNCR